MGMLGPLLNRKSDLSVRNGVLYKQLIRPMMDYACPARWSVALTHIRRLQLTIQMPSPRCWCPLVRKLQADTRGCGCCSVCRPHQSPDRELWLKVSWCGQPTSTAAGQIRWPRVDPVAWRESKGRQGPASQSRSSPAMAKSTKRTAFDADQPSVLWLPWLRFFRDFSSVVRQIPGYTMQSRGMARTPLPQARRLHLSAWQNSRTSSLRLSQSWLRPQTNQPTEMYPSHN